MRNPLRLGVLVLVVVLAFAAWRLGLFELHDRAHLAAFVQRVRAMRWAKPAFVALYALASAIAIPATPLTLAGGALFGFGWGASLNWLGAMAGASLAFAVARAFGARGHAWLARHPNPWLAALAGGGGVRTLFRLRVIPVVPFALLNFGSGMIRMPWRGYLLATGLGIVPVIVVYTLFAANLMAGAEGAGRRALVLALGAGVAIVLLSFAPRLVRRQ